MRAAKALDHVKLDNEDAQSGIRILRRALEAPLRQIVENAGYEGSVVVAEVSGKENQNEGFNALEGKVVDLIKAGIIDPKKVTRSAVQNAVSVAGTFLTTEAAIVEEPKKEAAAPAMPPGGMGGMGGMDMM